MPFGLSDGLPVVGDADHRCAGPIELLGQGHADAAEALDRDARAGELEAAGLRATAAMQRSAPRAVALRRPRVPPMAIGLPMTEAATVWPRCIESVSMIHAIVCEPVFTSGDGMSLSGPSSGLISVA